jgi:hypothetical protein
MVARKVGLLFWPCTMVLQVRACECASDC